MKSKVFKSEDGKELVVKHRKHAVILELDTDVKSNEYDFKFKFGVEEFKSLYSYLKGIVTESWVKFSPKEADSLGTDYNEYYDRKLDNNGYLKLKESEIFVSRPSLESNKLYQFNKNKMESFIYDFDKIMETL